VAALERDIGELYRTDCPAFGDADVPVKYFLWFKTIACETCRHEIDLFPGYLLAEDVRHPRNVLVCAQCGELNEVEDIHRAGSCSHCQHELLVSGPAKRGRCECPVCGTEAKFPRKGMGPLGRRLFAIEYANPARKGQYKGRLFKNPDAKDLARAEKARKRSSMVLKKWFTCMTGPAAAQLTVSDAHTAALHGCVESIRSGVTTLVDFMYVHPRPGLTQAVVDAYEVTGMRGFVCRGFLSDGVQYGVPEALIETPQAALADARRMIAANNRPGGRVQVGLAPCMIWTLDDESLRQTRALADELGVLLTIHVAETPFELEHAARVYGRSDTEVLSDLGVLGPDVLAVHCVQCGGRDLDLLRRHNTKVSHNPCSNLYLASGFAPVPEMLTRGITVGLGSDGPASSNNHSLFVRIRRGPPCG